MTCTSGHLLQQRASKTKIQLGLPSLLLFQLFHLCALPLMVRSFWSSAAAFQELENSRMCFSCMVTRPFDNNAVQSTTPTAGDRLASETNGALSLSRLVSCRVVSSRLFSSCSSLSPARWLFAQLVVLLFPSLFFTFISLIDVATCALMILERCVDLPWRHNDEQSLTKIVVGPV